MTEVKKTFFVTSDSLDKNLSHRLKNCYELSESLLSKNWKRVAILNLFKFIKWPFYIFSKLYVQDHLGLSSVIIGHKKYILISDGPTQFTAAEESSYQPFVPDKGKMLKEKICFILTHGPIFGKHFGTNKQCITRWVMSLDETRTRFIRNKRYQLIDIKAEWEHSEQEKKAYLLRVFNIDSDRLRLWQQTNVLLLSQPMMEDCCLTEQEMINIYQPYIEMYSNIVVKPHPRDKFDYKKHFPEVEIMDTVAPMQLLSLLGIVPQVAITICSSAVSEMPTNTKIIRLGTKVNDKIYKIYGDQYN